MTQPITTERTSDDDFAVFRETEDGIKHVGYVADEPSVETLNAGGPEGPAPTWETPTPEVPSEVWVTITATGNGNGDSLTVYASEPVANFSVKSWNRKPHGVDGYRWSKQAEPVRFVRADEVQRLIETAVSVALAAAARAA